MGSNSGHRPAGPAVGQQQRLEDLVRTVGAEDLVGRDPVALGQRLAELGRLAVGIAVEVDAGQPGPEGVEPLRRRRQGRLVGVEAHVHVDLGRVVAGEGDQIGADRGRRRPVVRRRCYCCHRRRTDSAWAGRPSVSARVTTWGPRTSRAFSLTVTAWMCRLKSSTLRALANRAVRLVGSTWLGPAR